METEEVDYIIPKNGTNIKYNEINSRRLNNLLCEENSSLKYIDNKIYASIHVINLSICKNLIGIVDSAFSSCKVNVLILPDNLKEIHDYEFAGNNLENVEIPSSIILIVFRPFVGNSNLRFVKIKEDSSLIEIGDKTFENTNLSSFYISQNVSSHGEDCFLGCQYFNEILVHPLNQNFLFANGCFYNKSCVITYQYKNITSINLPEADTINNKCFKNCYNLKFVNFTQALQKIGVEAFMNCNVENLDLPDSL